MKTREYLEQATGIELRIRSLEERIMRCREYAERITPSYSNSAGGTGLCDKISGNVAEEIDLEKTLSELRNEFKGFEKRVTLEIHRIRNNTSATLLEEKYINGATWEEITDKLGYKDCDYVRKELHNKALKDFEIANPENTRKTPFIPD